MTKTRLALSMFPFAFVVLASACTGGDPPVARVALWSRSEQGPNGANCSLTGDWLKIGNIGPTAQPPDLKVVPVENGAPSPLGGVAEVQCSVVPAGDGFDVTVSSALTQTAERGSVTVSGKFRGTGRQQGIRMVFQRADTGTFEQLDCTAEFKEGMGVAAGRVWAEFTCDKATKKDENRVCQFVGQYRFENCNQ